MSKKQVKNFQTPKWHLFFIVFIVLLLSISGLGNFYQKQPALTISSTTSQNLPFNSEVLLTQLNKKDIQVSIISENSKLLQLSMPNENQQNQAQRFLERQLGENFSVKKTEIDTRPSWLRKLALEPIKLGLDLNGGVLLMYQVDTNYALKQKLITANHLMQKQFRKSSLRGVQSEIAKENQLIVKSTSSQKLKQTITWLSKNFPNLVYQQQSSKVVTFEFSANHQLKFRNQIMAQSNNLLRQRIEKLGITEATIQRQGANKIRIELPGLKDKSEAEKLIGTTATLDFYQLSRNLGTQLKLPSGQSITIDPIPIFTGKNIHNAQAGQDDLGIPAVNLLLDEAGGKKMLDFSSRNIGKSMVTVFSEFYENAKGQTQKHSKVINVATIQQPLSSRFSITNLESPASARSLAESIRAGSLSAPITKVKQQTISATLGEANISSGFKALALGVAVTLVFMGFWYKQLGLVANLSLLINLVCLVGLLSILPGTVLTLPGIAGLVLTVGMAVDTNVLIFERIKQESKKARNYLTALEAGYNNAFKTIFDANITTLIAAVILYSIGFGPIKGFAITLCLGILTSMFSGIFVSRVISRWICKNTNSIQLRRQR